MRVTLLGTGGSAGVPMIGGADGSGDWGVCDPMQPRNRRTRASILMQHNDFALLVDTAPEMREQLVGNGVRRVDALLLTHAHADHISGFDDVRILNRIADRPLDLFTTQTTLDDLARRFDYAFRPWKPPGFFRPVVVPRPVTAGQVVVADGMIVHVIDQDHGFTRSLSPIPPTPWASTRPRSRRWKASIPGWWAAFSGAFTRRTPGSAGCWSG
jgi:phosphoribosyl 1,2-cyclic phosphate phosphodiesterase